MNNIFPQATLEQNQNQWLEFFTDVALSVLIQKPQGLVQKPTSSTI